MLEYLKEIISIIDWNAIVVLLVPIIIAGVKRFLDNLSSKINVPLLAMILGIVAEAIVSVSTGDTINPLLGAALGAIGIGIREWLDQQKKLSAKKV